MSQPDFNSETHRNLVKLAIAAAFADNEPVENAVAVILRQWMLPPTLDVSKLTASEKRRYGLS